jgi:hypothetical protein
MAHGTDKTREEDPSTNEQAHRNPVKTNDLKGEAQNVNDDAGRPLNENELGHALNKANESKGEESSQ